jgi:glyoxylase-like metal-dependent hydrolase (beta-lactamase superfamily II)
MGVSRRLICAILLFTLAVAAQSAPPPAAGSAVALPFQLKLIAPNIWVAIDDASGDAGANAGFVVGDDGVAVIDTFENETAAKALLAEIRKLTHLPVKFVVNTHYHIDHVAGNRVFANAGAVIVAQRRVKTWINTENLKFFGDKIKPDEKEMVERLLGPDVAYESELSLFLGTRRLDVKFFEGHTGGDSVVSIPDASVVFCGDLFWRKTLPNLIDATTSAWVNSLSDVVAIPTQNVPSDAASRAAVFVPGHGDIATAADVRDFEKYLEYLRSVTQTSVSENKSGDDLIAAVMPKLMKTYGSWDFFKDFSRSNITDMAAELRGSKRVPPRDKK